jgi:hypothetical protein
MSPANGMVTMDDCDAIECLKLTREAIGEVIDIGTVEDNAERPGWAMDVLQKLRYVEQQLENVLLPVSAESEAAE